MGQGQSDPAAADARGDPHRVEAGDTVPRVDRGLADHLLPEADTESKAAAGLGSGRSVGQCPGIWGAPAPPRTLSGAPDRRRARGRWPSSAGASPTQTRGRSTACPARGRPTAPAPDAQGTPAPGSRPSARRHRPPPPETPSPRAPGTGRFLRHPRPRGPRRPRSVETTRDGFPPPPATATRQRQSTPDRRYEIRCD